MTTTPLDSAYAAMQVDPGDDAARLRFFQRLADNELFLLLDSEPEGDRIAPRVFELTEGSVVLVFDREERLVAFTGQAAPYAALSGRGLVSMLAGSGIGFGLNLDVAPSSTLIPAKAVDWLRETLGQGPDAVKERPADVLAPGQLPEALLTALDTKLALAGGLAEAAFLAGVRYQSGGQGHLMAFVAPRPGAESALAKAVGEALTFSGIEAGSIDVGFFAPGDQIVGALQRVALKFELPVPEDRSVVTPVAPGSDPTKPPILR